MSRRNSVPEPRSGPGPIRIGERSRLRLYPSIAILFLAVAAGRASAQGPSFQAAVDKNPVAIGDQFTLSLTLNNAGMGGGKNLQLPDLGKFYIMGGPNESTSMQFINGAVSSSVSYAYVLQPKEIGKWTIGPATIEAGGKKYSTEPVVLEVVKAAPRPKQQAATPTQVESAAQIGDNLFLKAVVDKTHVIQGEQINLVFKLYTRVRVTNYGVDKNPTMTGFWGEEVEGPKNIDLSTETVNGKQYSVGVIRRIALFPTQSGTLEISPMEVQTTVTVQSPRSADPFDSFFRDPFGRSVNYTVKSEPVKVKVDPLPGGAPADFKGAVGTFAMSTEIDKRSTRTNEPVDLKVKISGQGNIKLLESPGLDVPPDFDQYPPKVSDAIERKGEKVFGSKTFEYLLIPRYPGLKIVKPVTFSYFDLAKREYVRLRSPQIELNVEQGAAAPAPLIAGSGREDVRLLSQDIRFIKIAPATFTPAGEYFFPGTVVIILLVLPLAGLGGAFVYARQRHADMIDQVGYRNKRAIRVARKGLKQAEYLLHEKSGPKGTPVTNQRLRFYSEVSRALWKYLGDKLNIPQAGFSVEAAMAELKNRSVDPGILHALKSLLESCDIARFAPSSLEVPAMQKSYDEARRLIIELEKTLRSRP